MYERIIAVIFLATVLGNAELSAQYLYFSGTPGECVTEDLYVVPADTFHICLHYPEDPGVTRAHFRVETDAYGPEDLATFFPASGVTIESGNPIDGMTLSWTSVPLVHHVLLTMMFEDNPPSQEHRFESQVWMRDAVLYRNPVDSISLADYRTALLWGTYECLNSIVLWEHPDTMNALIALYSTIQVSGVVRAAPGLEYSDITIMDSSGWVTGWDPPALIGKCLLCDWDWRTIEVAVEIPDGITSGTLSEMVVTPACCPDQATSLMIRAVTTSPVARTSLGSLKALFE